MKLVVRCRRALLAGFARSEQALCAVTVMEEARWETCICHWHIVKDCGLACCCQACLGLPCILGAAMERAGLGGCFPWCSAGCCCPCCTGCNARAQVAKKYGIEEGAPMSCIYACCCPFFSEIQIINQVHVTMPNHLKPFDVCFQMSLSGPAGLLYSPPYPTHGHSAHKTVSLKCPQILIKEHATWSCCGVSVDSATGAPEIEAIER